MKYIDSNVLIYATLDDNEKGEWYRDLLRKIERGKEKGFDPRDSIHASTALIHGIYTIVSEDSDFDELVDLNREWLD